MIAHGFSRPYPGLAACGDDFVIHHGVDGALLLGVVDGLGHGVEAARAAQLACAKMRETPEADPLTLMHECHAALRQSRGAAVAILRVGRDGDGTFCGVGNVEVRTLVGVPLSLFSMAGIVGHHMRRAREMKFQIRSGELHCLLTDGVQTRAELEVCLEGARESMPERIVKRWGRSYDDATALVFSLDAV